MYLLSLGKLYWFSRKLPQQASKTLLLASGARRVGANGYLRFSLETGNRREAEKLARRYAVEVDDALERIEILQRNADRPISPDDIRYAAEVMKSSLLATDEEMHQLAVAATLAGQDVERAPDRETGIFDELPPPGAKGDGELLKQLRAMIPFYLYTELGKVPQGSVTADYLPFVAAFREVADSMKQRALGKPAPTPARPATPATSRGPTWNDLLAYYWQHHPHASGSTQSLYRLAIRRLAEHAKVEPKQLTRAQVVAWRDSLITALSPKTSLTNLTAAGTVYRFALNSEKLGERRDPFAAVTIPGAKDAESSRQEFSLERLKQIFADPPELAEIPNAAGAHAAYWVPILALYTGARREELCGLLTADVQEDRGNVTLKLRANEVRGLKTKSSIRDVPLHKDVVALGFLDYFKVVREAQAPRLFPGLVNSDGLADWFIKHVQARIGKSTIKQDLHSFRHTLKTAARNAEMHPEMSDTITGHAPKGVAGKYGSPAGQQTLRRVLNRIKYRGVVLTPPPQATAAQIVEIMRKAERRRKAGEARIRGRLRSQQAAAKPAKRKRAG